MKKSFMKIRKTIKGCPLLVAILITWAGVAIAGQLPIAAEEIVENELPAEEDDWLVEEWASEEENLDQTEADNSKEQPDASGDTDLAEHAEASPGIVSDGAFTEQSDSALADSTQPEEQPQKVKPEFVSYEKIRTDSPYYTDPGKIPKTTKYEYAKVEENYFDDAVFIGDSRIEGFCDYAGLDNAAFFAKPGLTVYNLLDEEFIKDPKSGRMVSVSYMMKHYQYGKIYIMVGINELGTGGTDRYKAAYKNVLKHFRKWQPDAIIYVQSIMGVSAKKDATDPVFNNTNIRDKNCAIARLTDGIHIFYLDINHLYEDENHNLKQELTSDDVHLYAKHYKKWLKYLKSHAVLKESRFLQQTTEEIGG